MNEFDLRTFLYKNPLLEGEETDDADAKALDKKEDELDEKDMENETLKDKIKHHEGAIDSIKKELDDLTDDLGEDKEDLEKEKEEVKEESTPSKKLTKEGLKDMIREKISSILNEESSLNEAEEDDLDINIEDKEDVNIKDEVDIDDESSKSEMEIDGEIAGESSDKAAVLSLLTKAQELVPSLGGDEEQKDKMVQQINNTITMFARDYLAQSPK
tara:strand:- start:3834 stop:4478 length:645 start_codon:yes stop_codon:yes gene_type:complete